MGKGKRERMHISWMKLEGSVKTSSEGREEKETKGREERRERQSVLLFCFSLSFCSLLKISIHVHTHSHMHAQTVSFSRLLSQYSTIFHSLTHPPNHPLPCTQNIFPICIRHVLFSITNRKLKIFQLVQKFLTENINIEGSGLQARQSQLYIGEFQAF